MTPITDTAALAAFCDQQKGADFVAVDTEFMRDKTYWPQLCLVQVAGPQEAAAIDTLAEGLDLAPLYDLMVDPAVTKVFHAARQDIEIFHHQAGRIPAPVVDTQVVAMVCGFGDAVSYETLATKLAGARIDKSSRFTDWAHRPLSERQLRYALDDVIHLRTIHEKLDRRLQASGRGDWVREEMALLTNPATYAADPDEAWRRLKLRSDKPRFLALVRALAAWREGEAQTRNLPRGRVLKDEALVEIAAHAPRSVDELARTRGFSRAQAEGRHGATILQIVQDVLALPETKLPTAAPRADLPAGLGPLTDLLRVLLKTKCDSHQVAQKLVASAADLEQIAANDAAPVPALAGWRRELFGKEALDLKQGRLALTAVGKRVKLVQLGEAAE